MKRDQIEELFYGKPEQQRRFTQDFPILPDVWIEYGKAPDRRVEVLLTPHYESDAPTMARALRARLETDRQGAVKRRGTKKAAALDADRPRVLFNESVVLASLTFRELLRDAVPLTNWWQRVVAPLGSEWTLENIRTAAATLDTADRKKDRTPTGGDRKLLQKLIRVVGSIELDRLGQSLPPGTISAPGADERGDRRLRPGLRQPAEDSGGLRRRRLEHQPQPKSEHQRLALAADGEGRRGGAALRGQDDGHPVGGARHRYRRHAQGVPAPRRQQPDHQARPSEQGRRAEQPGGAHLRLPAHQEPARLRTRKRTPR
jgi:hypothetical protein